MKFSRIYILLHFVIVFVLQGCVKNDVEELKAVWHINNNSDNEIMACTVYESDETVRASLYVDSIIMVPRQYSCSVYSFRANFGPEVELVFHPDTKIYFVTPYGGISETEDTSDMKKIITRAKSYVELTPEWLDNHGYVINFPEDCMAVVEKSNL